MIDILVSVSRSLIKKFEVCLLANEDKSIASCSNPPSPYGLSDDQHGRTTCLRQFIRIGRVSSRLT